MKLERLHEYVTITVVMILGIGLAIYCGEKAGAGESGTVFGIFACLGAVAIGIFLRERIWFLIPLTIGLSGQINKFKEFPFPVRDLIVFLAFGTFLALIALKVVRKKVTYGLPELFLALNLIYMLTVFIRNPVGTYSLGLENVKIGGKPYAETIISCLCYWVLVRARMTPGQARWLPVLTLPVSFFNTFAGFIGQHFPELGDKLAEYYSNFSEGKNYLAGEIVADQGPWGDERQIYLENASTNLFNVICSYCRPITMLNPLLFWRFLLFLISITAMLFSGFRSGMFSLIFFFLVATYFQKRPIKDFVQLGFLAVPAMLLLVVLQSALPSLPLSAQRALSFLPGNWNKDAVVDSAASTDWRKDMWKEVLASDKYIANRTLGDGFGMTRQQFDIIQHSSSEDIENYMVAGDFHNGPLTTIRVVGYVGLGLFYILIIYMVMMAARIIRKSTDTPYFAAAIILGVPNICFPISFTFVFGAFNYAFPGVIISLGFLRLLDNSLDDYREEQRKAEGSQKVQEFRPALGRVPIGQDLLPV